MPVPVGRKKSPTAIMGWTPEMCAHKQRLVRQRVHRIWHHYDFVLDLSHLDDLSQEAWLAALTTPVDHPALPYRIDDQLRDYVSRWIHGCSVAAQWHQPRMLQYQEPLDAIDAMPHINAMPDLAQQAEQRQLIRRIEGETSTEEWDLWWEQVEEGSRYLKRPTRNKTLSNRRAQVRNRLQVKAQAIAESLDQDC